MSLTQHLSFRKKKHQKGSLLVLHSRRHIKLPPSWGSKQLEQEPCFQQSSSWLHCGLPLLAFPCSILGTFLVDSCGEEREATYSAIFISSRRTHPANRLHSPFVINTGQGHLKSIFFCSVLFFSSQNGKHSCTSEGLCFIISLALIALPHSPAYFKSVKSVLAIHCHWSSFPQLILRHHFSFWKTTKDPARTVIFFTTYFQMTSDPRILHSGSAVAATVIIQPFPVSTDLQVPCGS